MFTGYQLATLERAGIRPWISEKLPSDWDKVLKMLAGSPPPTVQYAISIMEALPPALRLQTPRKFGEIGWDVNGHLINDDVYGYQQIISLMFENGLFDYLIERIEKNGFVRIVEIGGGYGALAYHLMKILGQNVQYLIVDLPESLAFSSIYTSNLLPDVNSSMITTNTGFEAAEEPGFTYVPNLFCPHLDLNDGTIDLCINTLSFAEMSIAQVKFYCGFISGCIGKDGLFFEQNHRPEALDLESHLSSHFKKFRDCTTEIVPTYPSRRGGAKIWANSSGRG